MPNDKIVQIDQRLKRLETEEQEAGPQYISFDIVYWETYFDAGGQRCERRLPATYSDDVPFRPAGERLFTRVRYPLEFPEDQSNAND